MTELIKISELNGEKAVSARELYEFLSVSTRFDKWIKRMFEYGFVENVDFQRLTKNVQTPNGGLKKALSDYAITLDTAKEIAMIQRTEKGRLIRQYFIQIEKKNKNVPFLCTVNPIKAVEQYKKNNRLELVLLIRVFMKRGDMAQAARELGYTAPNIQAVMEGRIYNEKILLSMYEKAIRNKNECLFSVDDMINSLKTDNQYPNRLILKQLKYEKK